MFIATLVGGLIVFKYKKRFFNIIMAFSAGIFIATAFFNLIPESLELVNDFKLAAIFMAFGFLLFYVLQRFTILHACEEEECEYDKHKNIGILGASGIIFHSLLDGIAIGLAFQVSAKTALIVSAAVLTHKISDGAGLVSFMLHHKNPHKKSFMFLLLDSIVPLIGILLSSVIALPSLYLGLMLAFFAGFFIYIGATDLLPESHREYSSYKVLISTLIGFVIVYVLTSIVSV